VIGAEMDDLFVHYI